MRVAVIGTGNIGSTVGSGLARGGQDVVYGSRHPDTAGVDGTVTDIASALVGADAVLLALPSGAVGGFLEEYGAALAGVLIVDATNNMASSVANAAQAVRDAVPNARYVRAFNSLGFENFAEPLFDGVPADLFFSSSENDRAQAEELISAVGLRPAYLGDDKQDVVDLTLSLWFTLMRQRGNRRIAFRVVEK